MSFIDFNLQLTPRTVLKWLILKGFSKVYGFLNRRWYRSYQKHPERITHVNTPVISVGNITVGGSGKTPMIDWLLTFFEEKKISCSVLTRGYKADRENELEKLDRNSADFTRKEKYGDEPWLLFQKHKNSTFYISPNRSASAKEAIKHSDLILLDDGMQHLKLHRDLNIVLVDSVTAVGNGELIPLGPLREPLKNLNRADVVLYTKSNLTQNSTTQALISPFLSSNTPEFKSQYLPCFIVSPKGEKLPLSTLKEKKCFLFSGIGNPKSFEKAIEAVNGIVEDHLILKDHQDYDQSTVSKVIDKTSSQLFDYLICTEKDWVKLEKWKDKLPLIYRLEMRVKIEEGFFKFMEEWSKKYRIC